MLSSNKLLFLWDKSFFLGAGESRGRNSIDVTVFRCIHAFEDRKCTCGTRHNHESLLGLWPHFLEGKHTQEDRCKRVSEERATCYFRPGRKEWAGRVKLKNVGHSRPRMSSISFQFSLK